MARVTINETVLDGIADSIRNKLGTDEEYAPQNMAQAIDDIEGLNLMAGNIIANGVYTPSGDKNGFSSVTVNVPNSFSQEDEGKVVTNGYLSDQTSRSVTSNGTYDTTTNNSTIVNVQPTLQTKTATENGTVRPDSGYDGLSSVTVNVQGGGSTPVLNWDFKQSLVDSVHGVEATLTGASRGSDGITIGASTQYVNMNCRLLSPFRVFEIDMGDMVFSGSGHHRFFMPSDDSGLIYRNTGKWSLYAGGSGWATDSNITDYDYFSNSTIKIEIDKDGYWHIYKDNVLVYEPNVRYESSPYMYFGSSGQSCPNVTVEGFRVY